MLVLDKAVSTDIRMALLRDLRPWVSDLKPFVKGVPLPDSSRKFMAFDHMHRHFAVVICSPPAKPELVSGNLEAKEQAIRALGPLNGAILQALRSGAVDGLSYAIYPFCQPMYRSRLAWALQRLWIRPEVLAWLRTATRATLEQPTDRDLEESFAVPLKHLSEWGETPAVVREEAGSALRRLEGGSWQPRFCFMHGDLWRDNILLAPGSRGWRRFVLIDWECCLVRGYGLFDLIRLAMTVRLKGRPLRREVRAHCQILGCDVTDARSYLMAAIAHFGMNLGYFSVDNFVKMTLDCLDRLDSAGANRHV
jgi:hypothetical protein